MFKILRCFCTDRVNHDFLAVPGGYEAQFLSASRIRAFAKDPDLDMTPEFLDEALSKGDLCLGVLDGGTLAAYTWYSFRPTRIVPPDLLLHFDDTYAYIYKAFTRPEYRGNRLHAFGKSLVLKRFLAQGFRGLLSYVEYLNFPSLNSVKRIGGRPFGSILILGAFGHYLIYRSRGCGRFGFRLERTRPLAAIRLLVPPVTT